MATDPRHSRWLGGVRAARFSLWTLVARARLRRLGARLTLELAGAPPRCLGPLRLEIDGRPGDVTLRIGDDVKIGRDCVLDLAAGCDATVVLADRVTLQNRVRLQPWGGTIELREDVQARDDLAMKSTGTLTVGARVVLGRGSTLHCRERIELGADAGLGERVTVTDSDHTFDGSDVSFFREQPVRSAPVVIGANVLVAHNAVVLKGTTIGANAAVAAGAVVTGGELPGAHLIAGSPATAVRPLRAG